MYCNIFLALYIKFVKTDIFHQTEQGIQQRRNVFATRPSTMVEFHSLLWVYITLNKITLYVKLNTHGLKVIHVNTKILHERQRPTITTNLGQAHSPCDGVKHVLLAPNPQYDFLLLFAMSTKRENEISIFVIVETKTKLSDVSRYYPEMLQASSSPWNICSVWYFKIFS